MRQLFALLVALLFVPIAAGAASRDGQFAVKGAGLVTCDRFVTERAAQSRPYVIFLGWIDGYLTAYNWFSEETVDIAPWQQTELLAFFLDGFCKQNPDTQFVRAINEMIAALVPLRLRSASETVQAQAGEQSIAIYKDILRRTQQTLAELGYYEGELDGFYGEATRAAIETFQREKSIPVTGLPDQATLYNLFR